jgi:hypothetical protein
LNHVEVENDHSLNIELRLRRTREYSAEYSSREHDGERIERRQPAKPRRTKQNR